jgi:TonB family protein
MRRRTFLSWRLTAAVLAVSSAIAGDLEPTEVVGLEYPVVGRMARITGTVIVRLNVAPDGSVTRATPVSGHPVLAKAACDNAGRWKFEQTRSDSDTDQDVYLAYRFALKGNCAGRDCRTRFVVELPNLVIVTSEMPPVQVMKDK